VKVELHTLLTSALDRSTKRRRPEQKQLS